MYDPENVVFLQSIIEMAHKLHMRVVVEGIETEQELRAFASIGADDAQGFLLGLPVDDPADHFTAESNVFQLISSAMQNGNEPVDEAAISEA